MSFYEERVLPHLINFACGMDMISRKRADLVPHAEGRVLEIGMGSGLNLKHYDPNKVDLVWGLEPSEGMRRKARKNLSEAPVDVEWLGLPGEEIPLESDSADTVVLTFTLCTIPGWLDAVREMRRVLRPGGKLIFCEHGLAPDERVRNWQNRLNPIWKKVAGGCNLNRDIPECLREGGFNIRDLESDYLESPSIAGYVYWGSAD